MLDRNVLARNFEADVLIKDLTSFLAAAADTTLSIMGVPLNPFSTIVSLQKAFSGFRDYDLMIKVSKFLDDQSGQTFEQRKYLIDKINDNPVYGQKFAIFTLNALDRLDFPDKAVYLSRILTHYGLGNITRSQMLRFKTIVENFELEDLQALHVDGIIQDGFPENKYHLAFKRFESFGLIEVIMSIRTTNKGKDREKVEIDQRATKAKITGFGRLFNMIINDEFDERFVDV